MIAPMRPDDSFEAAIRPDGDGPEFADASFAIVERTRDTIERVWRSYWFPLLKMPDGRLNVDQLKGELFDAYHLVNEARKVYRAITGGLCEDLGASAEGIIAMYQHQVRKLTYKLQERIDDLETRNTDLRAENLRLHKRLKEAQDGTD